MTEDALIFATRGRREPPWPVQRVEPCACGGWIAADPTDPVDVTGAVTVHNLTDRHQWWRHAEEVAHGRPS
jgi:hypothetical protein